jgi:hypothetical protein
MDDIVESAGLDRAHDQGKKNGNEDAGGSDQRPSLVPPYVSPGENRYHSVILCFEEH